MRKKIIAANWKMNCTAVQASALFNDIQTSLDKLTHCPAEVVLCVPSLYIKHFAESKKTNKISIGAQNCYFENKGPYTGELSAEMIKSCGAEFCIIGHSERRNIFGESNEWVLKKSQACLQNQLKPIICVGEPIQIREQNTYISYIQQQLEAVYNHLNTEEAQKTIIAYEPVWAIGTGKNASPEQAQEVHHFIRQFLRKRYSPKTGDDFIILYGGSCNEKNARALFSCKDIDGGLIGGASLNAQSFIQIIHAAI
jgi:triosephosphate isomerase